MNSPRSTGAVGAAAALLLANSRFWPTVAPRTKRQLLRWHARAQRIPDPDLKALAIEKLRDGDFNAQVAATLATLAPARHRAAATTAIVACQVMYDYLDGLTEQPSADHLRGNLQLYRALTDAVALERAPGTADDYYAELPGRDDGGYLESLCRTVRNSLACLPGSAAVAAAATRSAERCAEAQARVHATGASDPAGLAVWAAAQAGDTALDWREWLAGAVASVLAVHALISAASRAQTTAADAAAIEDAYLSISALSTMLDGLVDWQRDQATGETPWLLSRFEHEAQLIESLTRTARRASLQARMLPDGAHHLMTMTGVVAYYTSAPGASDPHAAPIVRQLHSELGPVLAPTLAVMRAWRLAKRARSWL